MEFMPPLSPDDFVRGDLNAPVVLVHYGDFESQTLRCEFVPIEAVESLGVDAINRSFLDEAL
jgi:hypothetical protein